MTVHLNKQTHKFASGVLPSEVRVAKDKTYKVVDVDVFCDQVYYALEGEDILYRSDLFSPVEDLEETEYSVISSTINQ